MGEQWNWFGYGFQPLGGDLTRSTQAAAQRSGPMTGYTGWRHSESQTPCQNPCFPAKAEEQEALVLSCLVFRRSPSLPAPDRTVLSCCPYEPGGKLPCETWMQNALGSEKFRLFKRPQWWRAFSLPHEYPMECCCQKKHLHQIPFPSHFPPVHSSHRQFANNLTTVPL